MKALSLTQPWASLVAWGGKRIETRSWSTSYRGPLAIHAAKGWPVQARRLITVAPFHDEAIRAGYGSSPAPGVWPDPYPLGAIVATCHLIDCWRTTDVRLKDITPRERAFGDYGRGRFALILAQVEALPTPIPASGALGLWEWARP